MHAPPARPSREYSLRGRKMTETEIAAEIDNKYEQIKKLQKDIEMLYQLIAEQNPNTLVQPKEVLG